MKTAQLNLQEKQTIESYDKFGQEWSKTHDSLHAFKQKEIEDFHTFLPSGKLIEIGSGNGRDAKELIRLGYEYTGTDISETLLNQARKRNPRVSFFKQSIYELHFAKDFFDGFWAAAVLLHVPKAKVHIALMKIHTIVKSNGIGLITLKKGTGERMVEETSATGEKYSRFFAFYEKEEFIEILTKNNFSVLSVIERPKEYATSHNEWLVFIVKVIKKEI